MATEGIALKLMEQTQTYEFVVEGEPAQWTVWIKRGEPPAAFLAMQAWQIQIQAAIINKYGRPRLDYPVRIEAIFYRTLPGPVPKRERTWRRRCLKALGKQPDLTNLWKAFEDGLKGVLLMNDNLTADQATKKRFARIGEQPKTWCRVTPFHDELP